MKNYWDRFGILLSGLCVVHCVALPVFFAVFPTYSNGFLEERFHGYTLGFILLSAFMAFVPTYMKHKKAGILVLPTIAIIILAISAFVLHGDNHGYTESIGSIIGSALLIYAHYKHILKHDHCCNDIHDNCDTSKPDHGHHDHGHHDHTH